MSRVHFTRLVAQSSIAIYILLVVVLIAFSDSFILTICMSFLFLCLNIGAIYWIIQVGKFPPRIRYLLVAAQVSFFTDLFQIIISLWLISLTLVYSFFSNSPDRALYFLGGLLYSVGNQIFGWIILSINIEILISFAILNDRLNGKILSNTRMVLIGMWIILDIPAFVFIGRLINSVTTPTVDTVSYISFIVAIYSPAVLVVYDNLQSIFLIYSIRKLKHAKLKGKVLDLCVILTVLIALDISGMIGGILLLNSSLPQIYILNHQLYSSFGATLHALLTIIIFSTLRSIALEKVAVRRIPGERSIAKSILNPTVLVDRAELAIKANGEAENGQGTQIATRQMNVATQ